MSDTANKLFESLRIMKDGVQQGLGEALTQGGAELRRLGLQGATELASSMYAGHAFVPYGPGQQPPKLEHQQQYDRGIER